MSCPRDWLFAAALRDALPPVMLGVTRGAVAALLALQPGPIRVDQGAPDWADFLCGAAAADSPDTRALACEGLGLLPPTSRVLEALLARADDEPVVRDRAQASLARLAGQPRGAREWAEARLLADLTVTGLTALAAADRRTRAEGEAAMERVLLALPERAIADLDESLVRLSDEDGGGASCDVATPMGVMVTSVVARAVARAVDPAPLLARAAEGHVFVAVGLARGVASRAASGLLARVRRREASGRPLAASSEAGEEGEQAPVEEPPVEEPPVEGEAEAAEQEAQVLLDAIEVLASREEPAVRAPALRVVAALLGEPDDAWGERLRAAANHRDPGVRAAAWETRQALLDPRRATSAAWRAWFDGRERKPASPR